jgi:hypothetical protein
MTGKGKIQSIYNCNRLVSYLRKNGETGTRKIKLETGLTNLNSTHLWNFNQILIDAKETFRLSTRSAGERRELQWSIREKKSHDK